MVFIQFILGLNHSACVYSMCHLSGLRTCLWLSGCSMLFVCGRAGVQGFQAAVLGECVSARLSPLFGEFHCSVPERDMIYCPIQVQNDCNIDHILT